MAKTILNKGINKYYIGYIIDTTNSILGLTL